MNADYFVIDAMANPASSKKQATGDIERVAQRKLAAAYDAYQTTVENERYWAQSDNLSPQSANSREIRKKLRKRSRYECIESNSYARGMCLTAVNDVIGRGPRLQVTSDNKAFNTLIEQEFQAWAEEIGLARKLRTLYHAQIVDGEAFAEKITNNRNDHPVKLDLRLSEADLWTDPIPTRRIADPLEYDGIRFDRAGNPALYRRLKYHPGDNHLFSHPFEHDTLQPSEVIHWYREDRPDQKRGIPHFTPALPLFAELRRLILAVLAAYETAAEFAGVIYSDASAFQDDPDEVDPDTFWPIHRRALATMPSGWKLAQMKSEHPTAAFEMFEEKILMQISRCLLMPLNVSSGSSRRHNFASGRLDYLLWWNACDVQREDCRTVVLRKIFSWWLEEARLINDYLPPIGGRIPHRWHFPERRPVDEVAAAKAQEIRWNLGLLTDEQIFAEQSIDSDQHYEQLKRQYLARLAVHENTPLPGIQLSESLTPTPDKEEEENVDDQEPAEEEVENV